MGEANSNLQVRVVLLNVVLERSHERTYAQAQGWRKGDIPDVGVYVVMTRNAPYMTDARRSDKTRLPLARERESVTRAKSEARARSSSAE